MWAVVKIGAHQYKVKEGDVVDVQRLEKTSSGKLTLGQAMLYADAKTVEVGRPYLKDVKLEAQILGEKKAEKIIVYKYKRRKGYKRTRGHRQILTSLKILKIKIK